MHLEIGGGINDGCRMHAYFNIDVPAWRLLYWCTQNRFPICYFPPSHFFFIVFFKKSYVINWITLVDSFNEFLKTFFNLHCVSLKKYNFFVAFFRIHFFKQTKLVFVKFTIINFHTELFNNPPYSSRF